MYVIQTAADSTFMLEGWFIERLAARAGVPVAGLVWHHRELRPPPSG